jgi:hypothetical protein
MEKNIKKNIKKSKQQKSKIPFEEKGGGERKGERGRRKEREEKGKGGERKGRRKEREEKGKGGERKGERRKERKNEAMYLQNLILCRKGCSS